MGPKAPKDVKIYEFHPDDSWCKKEWCKGKAGFVRAQDKEVIPASKGRGMIALTPEDFSRVLEACPK